MKFIYAAVFMLIAHSVQAAEPEPSIDILAGVVSADQTGLDVEPLLMANARCFGFYTAAQALTKPEAKKEYESKANKHYELSHRLTSSYETLSDKFNNEVQGQMNYAFSLKTRDQIVDFVAKNSMKCSLLDDISVAIIKYYTPDQGSIEKTDKIVR